MHIPNRRGNKEMTKEELQKSDEIALTSAFQAVAHSVDRPYRARHPPRSSPCYCAITDLERFGGAIGPGNNQKPRGTAAYRQNVLKHKS